MRVRVPPKLFNPFQIENQMSKFKVGDKVKCIEASPCDGLIECSEHEIKKIDRDGLIYVGLNRDGFYDRRFELIPKLKPGDPVLCAWGSAPELEANRIYLIDSVSDGGALVINGKPWAPARFKTMKAYDEQRGYSLCKINKLNNREWYITRRFAEYMRDDGTFHDRMASGGGTWYETSALAKAALDRARGITATPVATEVAKPARLFHVGDTVVCRDIDMCGSKLELGKSYDVAYIYKETGRLAFTGVDDGGVGWDTDRFVLGKEAPKLVVTPSQHINITIPAGASVSVNNRPVDKPSPVFAAGDLIVCVDASPREDGPAHNLVQGGIYRVDSITTASEGHQLVSAESHGSTYPRQKGDWLASWRFEKYKGVAKPDRGPSPFQSLLNDRYWLGTPLLPSQFIWPSIAP
jgi:hypothetical protein